MFEQADIGTSQGGAFTYDPRSGRGLLAGRLIGQRLLLVDLGPIAGRLNGTVQLSGQGRSTAAILGSLRGRVHMNVVDGSISHFAVEAAGLDVAQAFGLLVNGDDSLTIDCGVADLAAERGAFKPRALVLDTADSTLWIDGTLSLAAVLPFIDFGATDPARDGAARCRAMAGR